MAEPVYKKTKAHSGFPALLREEGRTKGVVNQRRGLRLSPSERIASNYTPSARHLRIANIRNMKVQRRKGYLR